jgi:DNA-binding Lrp family transcriptional regulator
MILAKFLDNVPTEKEIKDIFDKEPRIQMAMMLTGKRYDLLFYVLVQNNEEINNLRIELTNNPDLKKYHMVLYFTPFYESYNFVPLRNEFIDTLKGMVIARKTVKNYPIIKDKQHTMLEREFAILKEWNLDGSIDLRDIDRKYGFDKGRAQYAYYRLLQSGIIKRITITMVNLPIKYTTMFSLKIFNYAGFYDTRKWLLNDIIADPLTPTNKYSLTGDIGSPFSILLFLPVFKEEDLTTKNELISRIKGIKSSVHTVTKIFGRLCFRRFDNSYSVQSETLAKLYNKPLSQRVDYFEKT